MAMEVDEDDVWGAVATSPSASPPPTALSLNTRLQLLAASGGGPFLPGVVGGGGCGSYRNVAASPPPSFFAAAASPSSSFFSAANASFPRLAPLDAGPARRALEGEMCLGPTAGAGAGTGGPVERRKKRMIKNRESASRSRARKQAHVTQIETEVMELREANEQLRLKYEQLKATVEVSVPVKRTLQRVLSAPF